MPLIVIRPKVISAPPIPRVRISDAITRLRVLPISTLFFTRVFTPTDAIVPKSSSIMPPRTASGMVFSSALTLPSTENSMPKIPAIRITEGSVIFVREIAPVTSEYVVTGGPPINEATIQAIPSPSIVRCRPGSEIKSLPATSFMAYMSPICSITGAIATGIIKIIASQQNSGRTNSGRANHDASSTGWKSTTPKITAAIYPTTIPAKIGISRSRPLPKSDTMTVVSRAVIASAQLLFAIFTPVPASERPISIITGPTTTGGKSREIKPTPRRRISRLIIPYTRPTETSPQSVPGSPKSSVALIIGAIKAKLLPKNTGTLPLVTAWKISVPTPAVSSATEGSRPTSNGTRTVAPKATKRNCALTTVFCRGDRVGLLFIIEVLKLSTKLTNFLYNVVNFAEKMLYLQ